MTKIRVGDVEIVEYVVVRRAILCPVTKLAQAIRTSMAEGFVIDTPAIYDGGTAFVVLERIIPDAAAYGNQPQWEDVFEVLDRVLIRRSVACSLLNMLEVIRTHEVEGFSGEIAPGSIDSPLIAFTMKKTVTIHSYGGAR